jgi:hypothetical protein
MDSPVADMMDCCISPEQPVDEVGRMSGTIGQEIATCPGQRFRRLSLGAGSAA